VARRRIIQTITLSKAFGAYGGAILSSRSFREKVIDRSRAFIGNTPLPLPLANAALQAVDILLGDKSLRKRLWANADTVKETALKLRLNLSTDCVMTPGPILRLAPESESQARAVHRALRAAKIFPPFTQYPGSGSGAFRFVISSEHTSGQIENLLGALSTAARSF
ncbi:MAG TPA: aminotransferase class I/II-fold pyridoxal phosphate-dependent enzyme, partial [Verrucomicrobiae bacterium]|nr:aminotransferase class I/II-fold pyridoxal phosphate-dependent enzyme [Verrucomicrobiae bacterium]